MSPIEQLQPITVILECGNKVIKNICPLPSNRYLSDSSGYTETTECSSKVVRAICAPESGFTDLSMFVRCSGDRGVAIHVQHRYQYSTLIGPTQEGHVYLRHHQPCYRLVTFPETGHQRIHLYSLVIVPQFGIEPIDRLAQGEDVVEQSLA